MTHRVELPEWEYKQFSIDLTSSEAGTEVKDGEVLAKVATLNLPDNEDDVVVTDSVKKQSIIVSAWNHSSKKLFGPPPVGVGIVYEDGEDLLARMQYFMDQKAGEEAYSTVKRLEEVCKWSIAYRCNEADYKQLGSGNDQRVIRYMYELEVDESSPVDKPGGLGTGTIDMKKARPSLHLERDHVQRLRLHKAWAQIQDSKI